MMTPTIGFNYEEIEERVAGSDKKLMAGFWDVGGNEATQIVYNAICQGIRFQAVLFVVDVSEEVESIYGRTRFMHKGNNEKKALS